MAGVVLLLALLFVLGAGETGLLALAWAFWTVLGWLALSWLVGHGIVADRFDGWLGRVLVAVLLWHVVLHP